MNLLKFIKCVFGVAFIGLIYIHLQMQIVELAYRGKAREKLVRKLIEQNGHLTSSIMAMKSANHLGEKLLSDKEDMRFGDLESVVRVSSKKIVPSHQRSVTHNTHQKLPKDNPMLSMLSWGDQAVAETKE